MMEATPTPKIDSLEFYADSIGSWDQSYGLENAEPGTDQHPYFLMNCISYYNRVPLSLANLGRLLADPCTHKTVFQ